MTITVHGFNAKGFIEATVEGARWAVPDDERNRIRQLIAQWESAGNTIPPYMLPGPTAADVDTERDRRIADGFYFQGVKYQSRTSDRENIAGAKSAASDAVALGAPTGDYAWQQLLDPGAPAVFAFIAADNSVHPMDAQTVVQFGYTALAHKQGLIFSARTLKNMETLPADYATNDSYWQ